MTIFKERIINATSTLQLAIADSASTLPDTATGAKQRKAHTLIKQLRDTGAEHYRIFVDKVPMADSEAMRAELQKVADGSQQRIDLERTENGHWTICPQPEPEPIPDLASRQKSLANLQRRQKSLANLQPGQHLDALGVKPLTTGQVSISARARGQQDAMRWFESLDTAERGQIIEQAFERKKYM